VLKMPLVLKPGSAEPWTPLRIIQSWLKAGAPPEAFCYYPTDHAGGNEILRSTGRGMVFGDVASTKRWKSDGRVEVHGPGYSKVVIGPDLADQWEQYIDVIAESMSNNGGRSCVNASGVWVTRHADAIAEALAKKLTTVTPRSSDDPAAVLAPFADPETAQRISATIDADMKGESGSARDVSASVRGSDRVASAHGGTYLLPTVIRCDADHPLANREFLFPFASVVPVAPGDLPDCLGPSLAVTAITDDDGLVRRLLDSPLVHRLNLGPIPTPHVTFDQPHEGNLFEHLYARRALQQHDAPRAAAASG
jgi:acyl-CoA reductase-like NAD-dependent aldehyde dehydrogenase